MADNIDFSNVGVLVKKTTFDSLDLQESLSLLNSDIDVNVDVNIEKQSNVIEKKKPRCSVCNVKLTLIDQSCPCRCKKTLCRKHLFPENHRCDFDYKGYGREVLKKIYPIFKVDKVKSL